MTSTAMSVPCLEKDANCGNQGEENRNHGVIAIIARPSDGRRTSPQAVDFTPRTGIGNRQVPFCHGARMLVRFAFSPVASKKAMTSPLKMES